MASKKLESDHYRVTIRVGIVVVFVSLFLSLSLVILVAVSWRFYDNAVVLTEKITTAISNTVQREVNMELAPAHSLSNLSANLLTTRTLTGSSVAPLIEYTQNILLVLNSAQMAYWGDEEGNFIISRKENDGTISSEVILRDPMRNVRYRLYRDKDGKVIRKVVIEKMDYDPRLRPWYELAKQAGRSVWSSAYVFYYGDTKTLGITSATPAFKDSNIKGIFGIDVKLEALSGFLKNIRVSINGSSMIVNKEGNLIAYSKPVKTPLMSVLDVEDRWVGAAYLEAKKHNFRKFNFRYNHKKYHVENFVIPGFERYEWTIFVIVPDEDITGPIWKANIQTILLCLLVLLAGVILISILSRRISKPIRLLSQDLERVRRFDIRSNQFVDSRVKEIYLMSSAIQRMKIGLLSFQKYVPKLLVEKLIETGEAAKLGGKRRKITMMFTDIAEFTSIAEKTSSENIMLHLCDYFDLVGTTIRKNRGIVDKFIGDAVMAFWGAPVLDKKHVYHACCAAVECQRELKEKNEKWASQGKEPLPTRIGLHTGSAIVGNLGSNERINYTAIGDMVNVASRLEQLNKTYNTGIIVSEEVYKKVSEDFIFRLLDRVVVRGREKVNNIYELLEIKNPNTEAEYEKLLTPFHRGMDAYRAQQWDEAIRHFNQVLELYPEDGPSKLFVARSLYFKDHPTGPDWHGVWVYHRKDGSE